MYTLYYSKFGLTRPIILMVTAISFDSENSSPLLLGKIAARKRVNKLDVEDNTVTIPASVCDRAIW